MSRFGFCGPSYTMQNVSADCQMAMNWYCETDEAQLGKSAIVMNPTPGLKLFGSVPGSQVRGILSLNSRMFAVVDAELFEVLSSGTMIAVGLVNNDGNPVSMVASPQQLAIASGGLIYVYYLKTIGAVPAGTFLNVPSPTFPGPVSSVGLSDGFFIVLIANTQQYFTSSPLDASSWPGLQTKIISTFPDNVVSMIVDHRQIYLFGGKASEVEYDSGASPVPFDTAPGGFIEEGCGAQFSTVQLDNSILWIGSRNDRGNGIAWRLSGYTPTRISNHAVEYAWSTYPTIADARAWVYQDGGHSFWVINFPSAQKTWAYDVATGLWHERGFWFEQAGIFQAALPQCHTFNFGKHLVGDRQSGNIYQMANAVLSGGTWSFCDDNGAMIRRVRRAPHISTENTRMVHSRLQLDMEVGLGPQPPLLDGAGQPRGPQVTMRYSDDAGHTWSNGQDMSCGESGNYLERIIWRRLGQSRDRVYEISCSDPVPYRIVDAYLDASPGFGPQERLVKQATKVA